MYILNDFLLASGPNFYLAFMSLLRLTVSLLLLLSSNTMLNRNLLPLCLQVIALCNLACIGYRELGGVLFHCLGKCFLFDPTSALSAAHTANWCRSSRGLRDIYRASCYGVIWGTSFSPAHFLPSATTIQFFVFSMGRQFFVLPFPSSSPWRL